MPGREGDPYYRQFPAPAAVAGYVEHVWLVEAAPRPWRRILLPSARPAVVTCLAEPGVRRDPLSGAAQPGGDAVFGLTTRPYLVEQHGPASYAGAQLTPWGLAALFPRDRLVDESLALDRWLGEQAVTGLTDRLRAEPDGAARADVLTGFLLTLLTPIEPRTLRLLHRLASTVERTGGQISGSGLATELGVSPSTVYRLCHTNIGLTPKEFCDLVRHHQFVRGLLRDEREPRAVLGRLTGYYDQAHVSADFKRYTGVTPAAYRRITRGIARLLQTGA